MISIVLVDAVHCGWNTQQKCALQTETIVWNSDCAVSRLDSVNLNIRVYGVQQTWIFSQIGQETK